MAYDEGLVQRIRECLQDNHDVTEKKMFGGLCFMVSGHMCCGIVGDKLMCRVGAENYEKCLADRDASEMDFTGRSMKGMVYLSPQGISEDCDLQRWVAICAKFVNSLAPKKPR